MAIIVSVVRDRVTEGPSYLHSLLSGFRFLLERLFPMFEVVELTNLCA